MLKNFFVATLALFALSAPAFAGPEGSDGYCYYNGAKYSKGAQISTVILECQADGSWSEKK